MLHNLSGKSVPSQRLATVSTRPLRVGFIVHRDVDYETVSQMVQFNSSVWGGKYNLFVPSDGISIREDWYRLTYMHDPDIIFFAGEITQALTEHLYSNLQPMQMFNWDDRTAKGVFEDNSFIKSVLVNSIFHHIYLEERNLTPENSKIRYPVIHQGHFEKYLNMLCGSYSEASGFAAAIKNHLGADEIECNPTTLADYLKLLEELGRWIIPYDLTSQNLNLSFPGFSSMGSYVLIISDGSLDDLFFFHAHRWSSRMFRGRPMACIVPRDALLTDENIHLLATWYGSQVAGNGFELASLSLSMKELEELRDKIKPHLPPRSDGWGVNIGRCNFDIAVPNLLSTERQQTVVFEDNKLSFELPRPDFVEQIDRDKQWVCEVELSRGFGNRQGFAPSMFPDLNALLSNTDRQFVTTGWGSRTRIARGSIALRVTVRDHIAIVNLPSHQKLIHAVCENAGFSVSQHRTAFYQGMIGLVGGIEEAHLLQNEKILGLFSHRAFVQGSAYTTTEMQRHLHIRKKYLSDFFDRIQTLANRQVLLRGFNLTCPICGLTTWYSISPVQEHMTCQGCFSRFSLPVKLGFAFKLNTLFVDRQTQGSLTVLLTLLLLHHTSRHSLIWQADMGLSKNGQEAEVDLVVMCDGNLIFAECKNKILSSTDLEKPQTRAQMLVPLIEQLQREFEIAKAMNAGLFLFATLDSEVPQEIQDLIAQLNQAEGRLAIRLVTRDELIKGRFILEGVVKNEQPPAIGNFVKPLPIFSSEECFAKDPDSPDMVMWGI